MLWRSLIPVSVLAASCAAPIYTNGIPDLRQVTAHVWRSGQLTSLEQWQFVRSLGVTQDVKLNFASEGSDELARLAGITVHELGIEPSDFLGSFQEPDRAKVDEALRIIVQAEQSRSEVVLVHCSHGRDRTGLVIGKFRLWQGWTKEDAWHEMIRDGFRPLPGLVAAWEDG